ncbi:MAG: restriction endonuclease subunit S [Oscillospiraceae bacterium]|nr:restriction endonuclease subunit S [Oscillospiraceae bacterium]
MEQRRIVNICDVCTEIFAGGDAPKNNMSETKTADYQIPIYSNGENKNGLYGYTNFSRVTQPSITISARGTIGYAAIRRSPFVPVVRLITVTPIPKMVDINYLYYAIHNYKFSGSGTSIPQLTVPMLKKYSFYLPDMNTQKDIVAVLDKVTDLINKRKQQLEKLNLLVKSRFVEMFGDIIQNDKVWDIYTFSDITSSRLGKMLDTKQQTGKFSYPYLANFNVQWFRFDISNLNKMDFDENDQKEFELLEGDLLVCEGGEIGRCAVWHNEIQPCYFQKALHRVRCDKRIILPDYLAWWFKFNCEHKGFSAIEGAKATIAHLPGAKLKMLKVAVPPIKLQNQFANFVKLVNKSKAEVQSGLEKLELLKKALMQKYFG